MYDTDVLTDAMARWSATLVPSHSPRNCRFPSNDRGILRSDLPKNPQACDAKMQKDWRLGAVTRAQTGMDLA
jgi:hypothetical protein